MQRSMLIAAAMALALSVAADARPRGRASLAAGLAAECGVSRPCVSADGGEARTLTGYAKRQARGGGVSLAGIVPDLAAKAREIQAACGSRVISAVRRTRIAGTRRMSLHASGKAVDMAGNPACMRRLLAGWPGGVSTDYARVQHYHISLDRTGGREMGARFRHGGATLSARSRKGRR